MGREEGNVDETDQLRDLTLSSQAGEVQQVAVKGQRRERSMDGKALFSYLSPVPKLTFVVSK